MSATETQAATGARPRALFALGRVVMTCGVNALVQGGAVNPIGLLRRHVTGDWGDMSDDDKAQNEAAVKSGEDRLMSSYPIAASPDGRVWIITEWDRSVTTLLLPSEY